MPAKACLLLFIEEWISIEKYINSVEVQADFRNSSGRFWENVRIEKLQPHIYSRQIQIIILDRGDRRASVCGHATSSQSPFSCNVQKLPTM